jgi:hypothetical protein
MAPLTSPLVDVPLRIADANAARTKLDRLGPIDALAEAHQQLLDLVVLVAEAATSAPSAASTSTMRLSLAPVAGS